MEIDLTVQFDLFNIVLRSLAALLVLLIPGWSLLAWLPGESPLHASQRRDFLSTLADGAGLSIALAALAALVFSYSGISVADMGIIALYAAGLLIFAAGAVWQKTRLMVSGFGRRMGPGLLGLLMLVGIIFFRLYQARELALPAWVDSVHHALIIQLIKASGGLPIDFSPYFPAEFHYHYGFHLIAALFSFWARVTTTEAMLWFGQVLNALVSLSVYRLAYTLASSFDLDQESLHGRWMPFGVAFTAALLTGFAFQMPAYYLTWGRYTLLSGLILLGPALAAAWEVRRDPRLTGAGLRLALLLAGISLTHYFVLILAGLFLLVFGLFSLFPLRNPLQWRSLATLAAWTGLGLILALPWLLPVVLANQTLAGVRLINPLDQSEAAREGALDYIRYIVFLLGPRHSHILMGMSGVGLLFAVRRPALRPMVFWAVLLGLFSLPWGLRLDLFRPDYFAIVLFFPAAIVLADLLVSGAASAAKLIQTRPAQRSRIQVAALSLVLALFLVWGIRETRSVINEVTVIAEPADLAALKWVRENTPPEARFFINSAGWIGDLYRGVDGGYWLAPYTGRLSLVPPALYGLAGPEYVQQVTDWAERAGKLEGCNPAFWSLVRDAGLTHIYLRQGQGQLQPDDLANCPRLHPIYLQEGVFIFEVMLPDQGATSQDGVSALQRFLVEKSITTHNNVSQKRVPAPSP